MHVMLCTLIYIQYTYIIYCWPPLISIKYQNVHSNILGEIVVNWPLARILNNIIRRERFVYYSVVKEIL